MQILFVRDRQHRSQNGQFLMATWARLRVADHVGWLNRSVNLSRQLSVVGRSVFEVAREKTSLGEPELLELLDPAKMTR